MRVDCGSCLLGPRRMMHPLMGLALGANECYDCGGKAHKSSFFTAALVLSLS